MLGVRVLPNGQQPINTMGIPGVLDCLPSGPPPWGFTQTISRQFPNSHVYTIYVSPLCQSNPFCNCIIDVHRDKNSQKATEIAHITPLCTTPEYRAPPCNPRTNPVQCQSIAPVHATPEYTIHDVTPKCSTPSHPIS